MRARNFVFPLHNLCSLWFTRGSLTNITPKSRDDFISWGVDFGLTLVPRRHCNRRRAVPAAR